MSTGICSASTDNHKHQQNHSSHINAPASVMGAHMHKEGDWMFSYSYMNMTMKGNLNGTSSVSNADIFAAGFMVAPLEMTMDMHMLSAMVGVTDDINIMLMVPYIKNTMDHITMANVRFTTSSEGFGDTELTTLYQAYNKNETQVILNAGLSLPTGSIDERDNTPMMANAKLPYPMQTGSGTYDLLLGASYISSENSWFWGAQGNAVMRTGTNDNQYTLGDRYQLLGWLGKSFNHHHLTAALSYDDWDNIDGADPELNASMVPTADPNRRGGKLTQLSLGYQFSENSAGSANNKFGIEYRLPVHQDLQGPQLETEQTISIFWSYTP